MVHYYKTACPLVVSCQLSVDGMLEILTDRWIRVSANLTILDTVQKLMYD
ncbi:MAG: hypothetical protein GDA48_18735 [Hormoscilla sp. GM102CHS1]|nr:hypothetical protein [Hormoscilla sp. GM102CHS1]